MKRILIVTALIVCSNALYSQGLIWNDEVAAHHKTYDRVGLSRAVSPTSVSLEKYLPHIMNQGQSDMCAAYSIATCRTILYARNNDLTDIDKISAEAYSPYYIYAKYKKTMGQAWEGGLGLYTDRINQFGYAKMKDIEYPYYYPFTKNSLWDFSLPSYVDLDIESVKNDKFDNIYSIYASDDAVDPAKEIIRQIKSELSKERPILYGMFPLPESWGGDGYWSDTIKIKCLAYFKQWKGTYIADEECNILTNDPSGFCKEHKPEDWKGGGHAMVVIGYDDEKYGGSFHILNSWGEDWGNNGKIWVNYDVFVKTAGFIQSFDKEKKSIFDSKKKSEKTRKKDIITFPENEIGLVTKDFSKVIDFNWIMFSQMTIEGGKYAGKKKDGLKEGKGTYILPNGVTYEGEWKNDKMDGIGKLTYNNMYQYNGEFISGYFHGNGVLTKFDSWGDVIEESDGIFANGYFVKGKKIIDIASSSWPGYRYEGAFENNNFNGFGIAKSYKALIVYEGEFKDGELNGKGKSNHYGDEYSGDFKNSVKHGYGILKYKNGDIKEGNWEWGEPVKE
jgi:hypothetical protein